MTINSCALLVTLTVLSTLVRAESRFIGAFDQQGFKVSVPTETAKPDVRVHLPSGHLPNPWFEIPERTQSRFHAKNRQLETIIGKATSNFESQLNKMRTGENFQIVRLAKQIAPLYGVDPAAVVTAVLVELTFNNDWTRTAQDVAVSMVTQGFYSGANEVREMMRQQPALVSCHPERSDYWTWVCMDNIWDLNLYRSSGLPFAGDSAGGAKRPTKQPGYIALKLMEKPLGGKIAPTVGYRSLGVTFGPAQISLLTALTVSDDVARVSRGRYPRVTIDDMPAVQKMVSEIEPSIHITAATIARSLKAYRNYAHIDISSNLGIMATLFNRGHELNLSLILGQTNAVKSVENWALPRENYFGYFANEHESEIRNLVNEVR